MGNTTRALAVFLSVVVLGDVATAQTNQVGIDSEQPPNVVLILLDDLGYADIGSFGSPNNQTPSIDRLAREGQKWTQFYAAASLCSPSRAGLLTGREPVRTGMYGKDTRVLFPDSLYGLPVEELTIAELLREQGYVSMAIGKWHLGHNERYMAINQGFDTFFGVPYSNDMNAINGWSREELINPVDPLAWDVPVMRDDVEIERPMNQRTITRRYTEQAVDFISANADQPFFLYLAHSMPHVPIFVDERFNDSSKGGRYGDVVEELDWSVGEVVRALEEEGLDKRTLVIFTSDNGPWLTMRQASGSAGMLRNGKGTTWEGGFRVPAIFWWPGHIVPGTRLEIGSFLDILPTILELTNANLPDDRAYDGVSLAPVLVRGAEGERQTVYFYREGDLCAIRHGRYKAHFITKRDFMSGPDDSTRSDEDAEALPLLFDLYSDPAEQFNIADSHPDVVDYLTGLRDQREQSFDKPAPLFDFRAGEE